MHSRNTSIGVPLHSTHFPEETEEVLPGVRWGRAEWVPSPAFWRTLASEQNAGDDYVSPEGTPLSEVAVFCLLGGYGVTAELNQAAFSHVVAKGLFAGEIKSAGQLRSVLSEPLQVGEKTLRYRYPNQRSVRVWEVLRALEGLENNWNSGRALRDDLLPINGIGPKTASWIARNWRGFDDVAILDVHVIRACQIMGLFPGVINLPKDYYALEERFIAFSFALGVRTSSLDALMWREMRLLNFLRPEV